MLYRTLNLPDLKLISRYEKTGNHAVSKYYKFPYSFFYQKKLKLILSLMDKQYDNIMDFGAGPARIFSPELRKRCNRLVSWDIGDTFNPHWRFSAIVCASVIEFVPNPYETFKLLISVLKTGGHIFIASPMDTPITRAYFNFIKDTRKRHPHGHIKTTGECSYYWNLESYKEWRGLYFAMKLVKTSV